MLRIILWKTGFEWAHLKRILDPRADRKVYYFAFGANLSEDVLSRRRISVYDAFDHILDNAELRFSQPGFYKNHGYASADPVDGQVLYGKMYLILEADAARMDYFEGVPFLKVHNKITGVVNGSAFYYYRAVEPTEGLKPTREYLDYLTTAYRNMSIVPDHYLEKLEKTQVLDQFILQNQTGIYVKDIRRWPKLMHPLLVLYEGCCLQLVEYLWNRSLIQWMIKL